MARQTKRIRKNIQTTQELEEALEEKPQGREYKPWENIVLVGIICLTMFLLSSGWSYFDTTNKAMYSLLLVALLLMYAQRRMKMTPTRETWIRRGIFAAIALASLAGIVLNAIFPAGDYAARAADDEPPKGNTFEV